MDTISDAEFGRALEGKGWSVGGAAARAVYATKDFATGARLFARIAQLAEAAGHHPDVEVTYSALTVRLTTHSAGGLTMKDVALAQQIAAAAHDMGVRPRPATAED